jgi:hypothetical protein
MENCYENIEELEFVTHSEQHIPSFLSNKSTVCRYGKACTFHPCKFYHGESSELNVYDIYIEGIPNYITHGSFKEFCKNINQQDFIYCNIRYPKSGYQYQTANVQYSSFQTVQKLLRFFRSFFFSASVVDGTVQFENHISNLFFTLVKNSCAKDRTADLLNSPLVYVEMCYSTLQTMKIKPQTRKIYKLQTPTDYWIPKFEKMKVSEVSLNHENELMLPENDEDEDELILQKNESDSDESVILENNF